MIRFNVFVRTPGCRYFYAAISASASDVISDAIDRFGPCYVSARPA